MKTAQQAERRKIEGRGHRDLSVHTSSACQLHDVKMTRRGLLHQGVTSLDKDERLYSKNFEALIKKQPNLRYADVKLVF